VGSSKFVLFIADRSVGTNGSLAVNGLGKKKNQTTKTKQKNQITRTKSQEPKNKNQKTKTKEQKNPKGIKCL
jgi:hypothetical protein